MGWGGKSQDNLEKNSQDEDAGQASFRANLDNVRERLVRIVFVKSVRVLGSWTLDTASWVQDPGTWTQEPGPRNQYPGTWIRDPRSRILAPGCWIQEPGSRELDPDPGSRILGTIV